MRLYWLMCVVGSLVYGAESDDEALFLRRIADFWQEGEYQIAKMQMEEFICEYPESPFSDALCAALGDLFLREKNYSNALNYYAQIQSTEFNQKVFLNRMQCLYEMQWYATLADECEAYLQTESNLHVTYFLAIALYHQCINASKETDSLLKLAERAQPHFETLYRSDLSNEISQGYAHLCCILKNYEKATEIYLDLARKDPKSEEEMLFQVALIQSEYNKQLALETFDRIAKLGGKKSKEAVYNRMVLAFELGRYEDLAKENSIDQIPPDRIGAARLFLGRSLLHLKKYQDAVQELKAYISEAPVSESLYAALLSLLDASYQCGDLISLDEAIEKLAASYPENPELPKAYFSRAQILKKQERYSDAKNQLESLLSQFPAFQQKAQAAFELTHLDYKLKNWHCCYQSGLKFLHEFPQHELAPFAWRYFVSSSSEIAAITPEHLPQLAVDLEMFLKLALSDTEKSEWQLLLAKTYFEMRQYEEAIKSLQNQESPNALLLLSLCYRDGYRDIQQFCEIAEQALSKGANLVEPGQLHLSLYNGYLELSQIEKGAQHLYQAYMAKAELKIDNLLWLADHYYNQFLEYEGNFVLAARAGALLDKCKTALQNDPCKADLQIESVLTKLAKVYSILGRLDEAITLMESLPFLGNEAKLILAEIYAKNGLAEKAAPLYDSIVASLGTGRSLIGAAARLQRARLKLAKETPNLVEIATQLKDLVVQKNFEGEPLYLEAALDYVSLIAKNDPSKKISLLQKTKSDFLQTEDLLSKDYHAARAQSSRKNQIFQGYMNLIDAEILAAQAEIDLQNQKELQAKSKTILLQMMNEQLCSSLDARVRKILADEP
jgi:TolA-binding protein